MWKAIQKIMRTIDRPNEHREHDAHVKYLHDEIALCRRVITGLQDENDRLRGVIRDSDTQLADVQREAIALEINLRSAGR